MTPVSTITCPVECGPPAGSGPAPQKQMCLAARGHYVSFLAGGPEASTSFDLIEVVVTDRGGPLARQHPRAMRYHVLEGRLRIMTEDGDWLERSATLSPGQTYAVAAGVAHAAHNPGPGPVRLLVGGQPGTADGYLAQLDHLSAAA